jgi:hypothetical protein
MLTLFPVPHPNIEPESNKVIESVAPIHVVVQEVSEEPVFSDLLTWLLVHRPFFKKFLSLMKTYLTSKKV